MNCRRLDARSRFAQHLSIPAKGCENAALSAESTKRGCKGTSTERMTSNSTDRCRRRFSEVKITARRFISSFTAEATRTNCLLSAAFGIECESMATATPARITKRTLKIVPALCLFLASLAILIFAAYPMYVIRPFREQRPAALERALWVLLHDKALSLIAASLVTLFALLLWRRAGWMAKLLLAPAMGLSVLAVTSTWINPFEHLFHPLGQPTYLAADRAAIDANDMVIAVTLGGESRAYPIREMGYHHVVNDRLHGLPIVVTY